jgi:acetyltransferase-like isoleucine patch superfamily enzyme
MSNPPNPFDRGYYTSEELRNFGFKQVGQNVKIATTCTIIGLENISLGNNIRIDDHVTILARTGSLELGDYIHLGGGSYLGCTAGIKMADFSGLSQGVKVYSCSDDYTGKHLTNPTVPRKFLNVRNGEVGLGKHVIIGAGSVILPGIQIGEGSSVGALSLVTKSLEEWGIYFGCPAKRLKSRSKDLLVLEQALRAETLAQ